MGETTLRIWPAVGHAYRFVWRNKLLFLSYSAVPLAISLAAAFSVASYGIHYRWGLIGNEIILFLCTGVVSVLWIRYFLIGTKESISLNVFSKRTLAFLFFLFLLNIPYRFGSYISNVSIIYAIRSVDGLGFPWIFAILVVWPLLSILGLLALHYGLLAVFALGLAAKAVDRPFRDHQIARAIKGKIWAVAAIFFLTHFPARFLVGIASEFIYPIKAEFAHIFEVHVHFAVSAVMSFVSMVLLSSAIAAAYKTLTGWPGMNEPLSEPR